MSVNRCYSEKKNGFDVEARSLFSSLHDLLEIKNLTHVRYLCRYDAEGLAPDDGLPCFTGEEGHRL